MSSSVTKGSKETPARMSENPASRNTRLSSLPIWGWPPFAVISFEKVSQPPLSSGSRKDESTNISRLEIIPPGFSTLRTSVKTAFVSGTCISRALQCATSNESFSKGRSVTSPVWNTARFGARRPMRRLGQCLSAIPPYRRRAVLPAPPLLRAPSKSFRDRTRNPEHADPA